MNISPPKLNNDDGSPPDTVATILLAAITATTSVLTLLGVNSDRVWVMLDHTRSAVVLTGAMVLAIVAVGLALMSYLIPPAQARWRVTFLLVATAFYLGGLGLAIYASSVAANIAGRPSIINLDATTAEGQMVVSLEITGASIDHDERLGVRLTDITSASETDPGEELITAFPRATGGRVTLKARLPITSTARVLEAKVWVIEPTDGAASDEPPCAEATTDPAADFADCMTVHLPG